MDKILYCDKCFAYWPEVCSGRETELQKQIAELKTALIDRAAMLSEGLDAWFEMDTDDKAKAREKIACQLAREMPEIFGDVK